MTCSNAVLTALTPSDFKARFSRGFVYLPTWDSSITYAIGNIVYYSNQFYTALTNNANKQPDINNTDWQVNPDINKNDYVSDDDITNAYASACLSINESLFSDDDLLKEAYLLLSAHKLACMLNEGGAESTPTFAEQSKSIGSVSASYAIPSWITESPTYGVYAKTQYGIDYITLIRPLINKVGITGRRGSNF